MIHYIVAAAGFGLIIFSGAAFPQTVLVQQMLAGGVALVVLANILKPSNK